MLKFETIHLPGYFTELDGEEFFVDESWLVGVWQPHGSTAENAKSFVGAEFDNRGILCGAVDISAHKLKAMMKWG